MKPLILIAIAILAVGCGKKKVAYEVVEPVDGSNSKPEGVSVEKLEPRETIWYLKDSETPYTGKVYSLYPNGKMKSQRNYKDGKLDGLIFAWHENGQKFWEENYKDGEPEGLGFAWHRNGQKAMEGMVENGKEVSQKFWNSKGESVNSFEETGL